MDRITRVRIQNVRAIASLELELSKGLTVLIGENGAGKSTILECLELLRRAAEPNFLSQFYEIHRGMPALLRKGATSLTLGVTVEDDAGDLPRLDYDLTLSKQGAGASIAKEKLTTTSNDPVRTPDSILARSSDELVIRTGPPEEETILDLIGGYEVGFRPIGTADRVSLFLQKHPPNALQPSIDRLVAVLASIEVHLGFDTHASWAARAYQRPESLRVGTTHRPASRLSLLGSNLANAWSELRNQSSTHWDHSLALVRLGLGERVDGVVTLPDAGGGNIHLALRFKGLDEPIFATDLSDGQLSWLAFVAMTRLNQGRSLLAIDEPELHMHPALLGGVMTLLKELNAPVLLATHADQVLELVDDPVDALRVCSLEHDGRVSVSRLDAATMPRWLEEFGDLGRLRASGYLPQVLQAETAPPAPQFPEGPEGVKS
jgi:predicted ATPase